MPILNPIGRLETAAIVAIHTLDVGYADPKDAWNSVDDPEWNIRMLRELFGKNPKKKTRATFRGRT
jgi:hypothetical protein